MAKACSAQAARPSLKHSPSVKETQILTQCNIFPSLCEHNQLSASNEMTVREPVSILKSFDHKFGSYLNSKSEVSSIKYYPLPPFFYFYSNFETI